MKVNRIANTKIIEYCTYFSSDDYIAQKLYQSIRKYIFCLILSNTFLEFIEIDNHLYFYFTISINKLISLLSL